MDGQYYNQDRGQTGVMKVHLGEFTLKNLHLKNRNKGSNSESMTELMKLAPRNINFMQM